MTPEEWKQVNLLLGQMKVEKDQAKFTDLLRQFNEIIARKKSRLEQSSKA